jgi:hypothetical protein
MVHLNEDVISGCIGDLVDIVVHGPQTVDFDSFGVYGGFGEVEVVLACYQSYLVLLNEVHGGK